MLNINTFKDETNKLFLTIKTILNENKTNIDDENLNELFRAIHSLKSAAAFYEFTAIVQLLHKAEDVLMLVREKDLAYSSIITSTYKELIDTVYILADMYISQNKPDDIVVSSVKNVNTKLDSILSKEPTQIDIEQVETDTIDDIHILIVDDVKLNRELLKLLVEEWCEENDLEEYLKIDMAQDGEVALDKVGNKKYYDIIFMDIMMPNMDGISSVQGIRLLDLKHQPTIVMATALMDNKTKISAKNAGANAYVTKPIKYDMIEAVLSKYLTKEYLNNRDIDKFGSSAFKDFDKPSSIVSAKEFLEECDEEVYIDDIEELETLFDIFIYSITVENMSKYTSNIIRTFELFDSLLSNFINFEQVIESITNMCSILEIIDLDILDTQTKQQVYDLLVGVLEDIKLWTNKVFVTQSLEDVFYINNTIVSDGMKLITLLRSS